MDQQVLQVLMARQELMVPQALQAQPELMEPMAWTELMVLTVQPDLQVLAEPMVFRVAQLVLPVLTA